MVGGIVVQVAVVDPPLVVTGAAAHRTAPEVVSTNSTAPVGMGKPDAGGRGWR